MAPVHVHVHVHARLHVHVHATCPGSQGSNTLCPYPYPTPPPAPNLSTLARQQHRRRAQTRRQGRRGFALFDVGEVLGLGLGLG